MDAVGSPVPGEGVLLLPHLRVERLHELAGEDPTLLRDAFETLRQHYKKIFLELPNVGQTGRDLSQLRLATLATSEFARNMGAEEVARLALALEETSRTGNSQSVLNESRALKTAFEQLEQVFSTYLAGREASAALASGRKRTRDVAVEQEVEFETLLLNPFILQGLRDMGYSRPSPIQLKAIPLGKFGSDLIAQAKSGTGKTAVFGIITLERIDLTLILAPTREIALQIHDVINSIGKHMPGLHCKCFIGGLPVYADIDKLRKCNVVVGTPGRVAQLLEQEAINIDDLDLLVLDEADKLLTGSFVQQIDDIIELLPSEMQMMAFSATFPPELIDHVKQYMNEPKYVMLNPEAPSLEGVRQYFCEVAAGSTPWRTYAAKVEKLLGLLGRVAFHQCLLFTNDKARAVSVAERLSEEGFPARYIAGGQPQEERMATMHALRTFALRVLVTTDLTARGIDVDRVNLVINLDVPSDPETYLHRIGRTGRFGTYGIAVNFVVRSEVAALQRLVGAYNSCVEPLPAEIPHDFYEYELANQEEQEAATRLTEERSRALTAPKIAARDWAAEMEAKAKAYREEKLQEALNTKRQKREEGHYEDGEIDSEEGGEDENEEVEEEEEQEDEEKEEEVEEVEGDEGKEAFKEEKEVEEEEEEEKEEGENNEEQLEVAGSVELSGTAPFVSVNPSATEATSYRAWNQWNSPNSAFDSQTHYSNASWTQHCPWPSYSAPSWNSYSANSHWHPPYSHPIVPPPTPHFPLASPPPIVPLPWNMFAPPSFPWPMGLRLPAPDPHNYPVFPYFIS